MIIGGKNKKAHNINFLVFMEKCMTNNLTLSAKKIQFKQPQISLFGHCWYKDGISPDSKKDPDY